MFLLVIIFWAIFVRPFILKYGMKYFNLQTKMTWLESLKKLVFAVFWGDFIVPLIIIMISGLIILTSDSYEVQVITSLIATISMLFLHLSVYFGLLKKIILKHTEKSSTFRKMFSVIFLSIILQYASLWYLMERTSVLYTPQNDQILVNSSIDNLSKITDTSYFNIKGVPDVVKAGVPFSAVIVARKENGEVDEYFTGIIRLGGTVEMDKIYDYEFKKLDKGIKEIGPIKLKDKGEKTFSVIYLEDFRISGEKSIIILEK